MERGSIEKGFYYHYKHDPSKGVDDYAYEVIGVALHTETGDLEVIYKPLYDASAIAPAEYFVRPYDMFIEDVEKEGKTFPRFQRIVDPATIEELEKIKID